MGKKRMGRPPVEKNMLRNKRIAITLTSSEYESIMARAKRDGAEYPHPVIQGIIPASACKIVNQ